MNHKHTSVNALAIVERMHTAGLLGVASEVAHEHQLTMFDLFFDKSSANARAQFCQVVRALRKVTDVELSRLLMMDPACVAPMLLDYELKLHRKYRKESELARRGLA